MAARTGTCNLTENSICGNRITGVELSKADHSAEGEDPPPTCEIVGNKINCNLESGLKIWYQGAAKLEKNTIEANLERILITPRSRRHVEMGERDEDQPKGGCYAKLYGSNCVREYDVLLNPPDPPVDDPTLGAQAEPVAGQED